LKLPYLALTAAYCAVIFWFSSSAAPLHVDMAFAGQDKVVHALVYAGLAVTIAIGLKRSRVYSPRVWLWAPIVFVALYGASDEIHQLFVRGRTGDVWDWSADLAGAVVIQIILRWKGVLSYERP